MSELILKALKLQSAGTLELLVFATAALVAALVVGMLIDVVSERASFGSFANCGILLALSFAAAVAHFKFVAPLHFSHAALFPAMMIAAVVSSFVALSYAKIAITR